MDGPWTQYQSQGGAATPATPGAGPWTQYQQSAAQPTTPQHGPWDQYAVPQQTQTQRVPGLAPGYDKVVSSDQPAPQQPQPLQRRKLSPQEAALSPWEKFTHGVSDPDHPNMWNAVYGLSGAFNESVTNGLMMQPLRQGMESLGIGMDRVKQLYPNATPDQQKALLHQFYNQAVSGARQQAAQQTLDNPYPGHQVGNFAANVLGSADPSWFFAPGSTGAGKTAIAQIASRAGKQAAIGSISNSAAQAMDILEGQKKDYDVGENLQSAAFAGTFGGAHAALGEAAAHPVVSDFVKNLFKERGVDTKPNADPRGNTTPMTGATVSLSDADKVTLKGLLKTGSVDDIKNFLNQKQGPKPSWAQVDQLVQTRDSMPENYIGKDNFNQAINDTIDSHQHQLVSDHVATQTAKWKNAPDIEVVRNPGAIADENVRGRTLGEDPNGNALGIYGADGKVRIFSDRINSPELANAVLFHEALGHYGLAQRFGAGLESMMNTLVTRNVGRFGDQVRARMAANPKESQALAAEEVLAKMSQDGPLKPVLADAVSAKLKQFGNYIGRSMGRGDIFTRFSDNEIQHILAMSHDAVINGKGRDVRANGFRGTKESGSAPNSNWLNMDGPVEPSKFMYTGPNAGNYSERNPTHFTASDGVGRNEISDMNAHLNLPDEEGHYKLGDILEHSRLYREYPELKNMDVYHRDLGDHQAGAYMTDKDDPELGRHILLNTRDPNKLSTALHETQHAIQDIEQYPDFTAADKEGGSDKLAYDDYVNHPSEKEAYATEARRGMTNRERADTNIVDSALNEPKFMQKSQYDSHFEIKPANEGIDNTRSFMSAFSHARSGELLRGLNSVDPSLRENALMHLSWAIGDHRMDTGFVDRSMLHIDPDAPLDDRLDKLTDAIHSVTDDMKVGKDPQLSMRKLDREWRNLSQSDPKAANGIVDKWDSSLWRNFYSKYATAPESLANDVTNDTQTPKSANNNGRGVKFMTRSDFTPKDVAEEAYERLGQNYKPTYRSWDDAKAAADTRALDPANVRNMRSVGNLDKTLFIYDNAAKELNDHLLGLASKHESSGLTDEEYVSGMGAAAHFNYVLGRLEHDAGQVARALNAMKAIRFSRNNLLKLRDALAEGDTNMEGLANPETFEKFLMKYKDLAANGNPHGAAVAVRSLSTPNWEDYLITLHNNMMLSSLGTQFKAPLDMATGIGREMEESFVASAIGSPIRAALQAAGINVKPGVHPAEVYMRGWAIVRAALDSSTWTNTWRALKGETVNPQGFSGAQNARIPVVSKITDLISAHDAFFRAFATNMHLYGLGTRRAIEETLAEGKKIDLDYVMTQGSNYARTPTTAMLDEARAAADRLSNPDITQTEAQTKADEATVVAMDREEQFYKGAKQAADETLLLNKGTSKVSKMLQQLKSAGPDASAADRAIAFTANFLTPFVRVLSNSIVNRVVRRSPLAFFDRQTLGDLRAGGARSDMAMTRIILGTAGMALAWNAASQGKLTGSGPDDYNKKLEMEAGGWRPNAVRENGQYNTGGTLPMSFNPADIHNETANLMADLHDNWEKGVSKGGLMKGFQMAALGTFSSLAKMSWLNDISPAMDAINSPNTNKPAQFAANEVGTMMPNALSQVARVAQQNQPVLKDMNSSGENRQSIPRTIASKIPGVRDQMQSQYDVYGNPVQSGASMLGQHSWLPQDNRLTGGNHFNETNDPAEKELQRLSNDPSLKGKALVTPVSTRINVNDTSRFRSEQIVDADNGTVKLTPDQIAQYQHLAGRYIVEATRKLMQTSSYQRLPDKDKVAEIQALIGEQKDKAEEELYGQ